MQHHPSPGPGSELELELGPLDRTQVQTGDLVLVFVGHQFVEIAGVGGGHRERRAWTLLKFCAEYRQHVVR